MRKRIIVCVTTKKIREQETVLSALSLFLYVLVFGRFSKFTINWVPLYINQSNRKIIRVVHRLLVFLLLSFHLNGGIHELAPSQELFAGFIFNVLVECLGATLLRRGGVHQLPSGIGST